MPSYRIEVMKKVLVRKIGGCQPYTLQPVEVRVARLLVFLLLLGVEGPPVGAGGVVGGGRGAVAVGDCRSHMSGSRYSHRASCPEHDTADGITPSSPLTFSFSL